MNFAKTVPRLLTAEEFHDFTHRPENERRMVGGFMHGEVIELPSPRKRHGMVCAAIARLLGNCAAEHRGYAESNDAGVLLERSPDTVRGPDVAYFDNEPSEEELDGYSTTLPLLVVEVLSPDDRADGWRKITDYQKSGIPLVWLVDPAGRNVTVYKPMAMPRLLEADETLEGEDILPGFQCKVGDLFPRLQPRRTSPEGRISLAAGRNEGRLSTHFIGIKTTLPANNGYSLLCLVQMIADLLIASLPR